MIQINLYVPPEMLEALKEEQAKTGAAMSEIIRRSITSYLNVKSK